MIVASFKRLIVDRLIRYRVAHGGLCCIQEKLKIALPPSFSIVSNDRSGIVDPCKRYCTLLWKGNRHTNEHKTCISSSTAVASDRNNECVHVTQWIPGSLIKLSEMRFILTRASHKAQQREAELGRGKSRMNEVRPGRNHHRAEVYSHKEYA